MPYTHKKVGDKAALHIADKPKKESIKENMMEQGLDMEPGQLGHPGCEDAVGKIFVVLKPTPETSAVDLVHPTHAFGMGQFDSQGIHGIYNDEEEANLVAEAAQKGFHKHLAEVENKKEEVLERISENIARLQAEINNHMKEATEKPELSEAHHMQAERKMNIIKSLRDKHKMVKESKKQLPKKEEE